MTPSANHRLMRAIIKWQAAELLLARARETVERESSALHGQVGIREIARHTNLSAATVSHFFRGRLVVSSDTALRLAHTASKLLTYGGRT